MLAINVVEGASCPLHAVEVRLDGKISVPLIDDVQAAGLTPSQLKASITERLKEYVDGAAGHRDRHTGRAPRSST
mgnify:CR=1 FL=1